MDEERPKDRDGWPIHVGARCIRFTRDGFQLKERVIVKGFSSTPKYPITVDVEGLLSGNLGATLPSLLKVLATPDGDKAPLSVQRYRARKKDAVLLAELKERKTETRKKQAAERKKVKA